MAVSQIDGRLIFRRAPNDMSTLSPYCTRFFSRHNLHILQKDRPGNSKQTSFYCTTIGRLVPVIRLLKLLPVFF